MRPYRDKKLIDFFDKNLLRRFESGAISYRPCDSAWSESALETAHGARIWSNVLVRGLTQESMFFWEARSPRRFEPNVGAVEARLFQARVRRHASRMK
jgi:hypothetical protein